MPMQERGEGGLKRRYSSKPTAASATYEGVVGQHHAPAVLTPGKDQVSIIQEAVYV